MSNFSIELSDDRKEITISLPGIPKILKMSAPELEEFIRQMAWQRASMLPGQLNQDPAPGTPVSSLPAYRWFLTADDTHGQARLHLLHPGFGWLWMAIDQAAFDNMSKAIRYFFETPTSKH